MFLSRFFAKKKNQDDGVDAEKVFALRHNAFKLFLKSWNGFQDTMTQVEYTLCCDHPFGLHRVQELCTSVATQVFQCIHHLERLDPKPIPNLTKQFDHLANLVAKSVYPVYQGAHGPLTLPFFDIPPSAFPLVDPGTVRLAKLKARYPEYVPDGFVLTQAGCDHFYLQGDLLSELARRIQAAGGLGPLHLAKLERSMRHCLLKEVLPADLWAEVLLQVAALRKRLNDADYTLVLRGRIWPQPVSRDEGGEPVNDVPEPGLMLWGPAVSLLASDEELAKALVATLAAKYRAQAMIYLRARGLTPAETGFCVSCLAVPKPVAGGLAHAGTPFDPSSDVTIYACQGLPQEMEYSTLPVATIVVAEGGEYVFHKQEGSPGPWPNLGKIVLQKVADLARSLEAELAGPISLTFVSSGEENLSLLFVRKLLNTPNYCLLPSESDSKVLLSGGIRVSPGRASGVVNCARTFEDVRRFQKGGVLVVPDDQYLWVSVIDRVSAIICERGVLSSRLSSLAREFGIPVLFMPGALSVLENGQVVTVCADLKKVFLGKDKDLLVNAPPRKDFMQGSPVLRLLSKAAEHILPLTMDVDSVDFRSENCQTYHDQARFCHERAVSAMFSLGAAKKYAPTRVKQLFDGVPKQFWVVNLSNGFLSQPKGPLVDIKEIASAPMLALWDGMNRYPWEGPPPVDGKGFLSVLFEATANPNLEPSAQTTYFSEKNYFLISRDYMSLHSRFGFHFVSVEASLSERSRENSIVFQLRGGAADIERRILRVRFVADLLWEFGFAAQLSNDALIARLEGLPLEEGLKVLGVAGYLTIHTRQLDMIMQDRVAVRARFKAMLEHCRLIYLSSKSA